MNVVKVVDFFREVRSELKKVAWPETKETLHVFVLVTIVVLIASLLLLFIDGMVYKAINFFLKLGG